MSMEERDRPDELDGRVLDLARQYHEPPPAPRDEMWAVIAERRRKGAPVRVIPLVHRPVFRVGIGIAALLVLGIGIGRVTAPRTPAPDVAAAPATSPSPVALDLAAGRHLEQSEAFLTLFRASVESGGADEFAMASAQELLLNNRLLLDSPASSDPRMRQLLEDLELVLAQIAQLPAEGPGADERRITDGMEAGSMLPRLRTVTSDGVAATLRQGAL